MSLDRLRKEIADIDEEILTLIKKRLDTAQKVGEEKEKQNLPIKDYSVEKKVFERNLKVANRLGLYPKMADAISHILIKFALHTQDEHKSLKEQQKLLNQKKVLVIGGAGRMGKWFANYFHSLGHLVSILDPEAKAKSNFQLTTDLQTAAKENNIIVIATPLSKTAKTIDAVTETQTKALVFDIASLKSPLLASIKNAEKKGIKISSIHPMYGDQIKILAGQNIIICHTSNKKAFEETHALFKETTAETPQIDLEDHDHLMGYVLGLSHLSNLVFAHTLRQGKFDYKTLMQFSSTTFNSQIKVTKPVTEENKSLYYEIQSENFYTEEVIKSFKEQLNIFEKSILDKNESRFCELMEKSQKFLK